MALGHDNMGVINMNSLVEIGGIKIHSDISGRFSLNDLHKASGCEDRHRPSRFLENLQSQELIAELQTDGIPAVSSSQGRNGGTYACKEIVYAYAMWISPKFNLQVIRTFDSVVSTKAQPRSLSSDALAATKLFRPFFQIARLIGCDKPAAAISANQAVQQVSGTNIMALLGQTHIEAENQEVLFFTPTELGDRIGVSGRKLNLLLAETGLQLKRGDAWEVMENGKLFARIYDTGKRHGSGVPIQQIKWAATVLPLLKQGEEA